MAPTSPRYEKHARNGTGIIPQTTSTTCPMAIALKMMRAPPTTNARCRSPGRQVVIVASTKKMTSKSRLPCDRGENEKDAADNTEDQTHNPKLASSCKRGDRRDGNCDLKHGHPAREHF